MCFAVKSAVASPALAHLQSINIDLINLLKQVINNDLKSAAGHPSPHSDFIFT